MRLFQSKIVKDYANNYKVLNNRIIKAFEYLKAINKTSDPESELTRIWKSEIQDIIMDIRVSLSDDTLEKNIE
jgi:hypothetical protein